MIIILTLILALIAIKLNKYIRKYDKYIMILLIILSIISASTNFELFTLGYLGLAFYIVVMYAGSFPKGSKLYKKLRSVRKEYAIYGFITLVPHFGIYIYSYINNLIDIEYFGLIAFIIMIPLFIISFKFIKRKINIKTWFKIQKLSYIVYLLIYIHLMLVASNENQIIYSIIFITYTTFKLYNYTFKNIPFLKYLLITSVLLVAIKLLVNLDNISANTYTISNIDTTLIEDGTYTGYGTGYHGLQTKVEVTISNGTIIDIDILSYGSTEPHHGMDYYLAAEQIVQDIIEAQTINVDSISGATSTSHGILEAVSDALE